MTGQSLCRKSKKRFAKTNFFRARPVNWLKKPSGIKTRQSRKMARQVQSTQKFVGEIQQKIFIFFILAWFFGPVPWSRWPSWERWQSEARWIWYPREEETRFRSLQSGILRQGREKGDRTRWAGGRCTFYPSLFRCFASPSSVLWHQKSLMGRKRRWTRTLGSFHSKSREATIVGEVWSRKITSSPRLIAWISGLSRIH